MKSTDNRRLLYLLDSLSGTADRMSNYGDDFHMGISAGICMAVDLVRDAIKKEEEGQT